MIIEQHVTPQHQQPDATRDGQLGPLQRLERQASVTLAQPLPGEKAGHLSRRQSLPHARMLKMGRAWVPVTEVPDRYGVNAYLSRRDRGALMHS